MKLEIISDSRDSAILVGDEDHNDIADFYHSDHATVGQSYETALALAKQLVAGCGDHAQAGKPCGEPVAWQYREVPSGIWRHCDIVTDNPDLEYRALYASPASPAPSSWQPIETAPKDKDVMLGWWATWPELHWEYSSGLAGSTKGGWLHGQATHWQPLPAPPSPVSSTKSGGAA